MSLTVVSNRLKKHTRSNFAFLIVLELWSTILQWQITFWFFPTFHFGKLVRIALEKLWWITATVKFFGAFTMEMKLSQCYFCWRECISAICDQTMHSNLWLSAEGKPCLCMRQFLWTFCCIGFSWFSVHIRCKSTDY